MKVVETEVEKIDLKLIEIIRTDEVVTLWR